MTDALGGLRNLSNARDVVAEVARRHGVLLLVAFGSAAVRHLGGSDPGRRDPRDLDLAVRFGGEPRLLEFLDELVQVAGFQGIDLLDLRRADPVAKEQALADPVVLYEATPGTAAVEQMAAITEWMDSAWLRRLSLNRLAK